MLFLSACAGNGRGTQKRFFGCMLTSTMHKKLKEIDDAINGTDNEEEEISEESKYIINKIKKLQNENDKLRKGGKITKTELEHFKFTNRCAVIDCIETELREVDKVSCFLDYYGLKRQVMLGDNNTPQSSYIYAGERLKWNAWAKYKGLSKKQALKKFNKLYDELVEKYAAVFEECKEKVTLNQSQSELVFKTSSNKIRIYIPNGYCFA